MKKIVSLLALSIVPLCGATVWKTTPNAIASASWDVWTFSSSSPASGSQGVPQGTTGSLINIAASDLTTRVFGPLNPPSGLYGGGERYYIHNGGFQWMPSVSLTENASHVRVSYSLAQAGTIFDVAPDISGATLLNSGVYLADDGQNVFFRDFELASPANVITTNAFGNADNMPGGSRSFDSLLVEVFDAAPIPEPSSVLLFGLAVLSLLRRRRA
ncbi:MAG: hypothetical protein ACJAVK_001243 [Akkermansiaceae bacterium]|jgi:hypothetical protein